MNERFRELAEQIVCFEQDMDGAMEPNEDGQWIRADDLEKFAELIVKECQHRVEQYINECGEVASMPDRVIMKHFGVE